MNEMGHEEAMQYFRDQFGDEGATYPYTNALMLEIHLKEFFREGFKQGYEKAMKRQGNGR